MKLFRLCIIAFVALATTSCTLGDFVAITAPLAIEETVEDLPCEIVAPQPQSI